MFVARAVFGAVAGALWIEALTGFTALLVGARVPVGDPLEGVARHVVEPELIRRARAHRPHPTGLGFLALLEQAAAPALLALDDRQLAGRLLVAPRIEAPVRTARGLLPLSLGRQALALRSAVGLSVEPADAVDGLLRPVEIEVLGPGAGALAGLLAGLVLGVGDLVAVHPKGLNPDVCAWAGVLGALVGAADERTPGDAAHLLGALVAVEHGCAVGRRQLDGLGLGLGLGVRVFSLVPGPLAR